MRRVDPEDAAKPGPLLGVFQVDQHLLGNGAGVLCTEQGKTAAMLEPADDRLVVEPGDDQLAVELLDVFLFLGIGDRRAVGDDRGHRVAADENAAVVALGGEPLAARFRKPRAFVADRDGALGRSRSGRESRGARVGLIVEGREGPAPRSAGTRRSGPSSAIFVGLASSRSVLSRGAEGPF